MRRTADIARAAAAAAAVALLVIGLPAFLVASVGWPLPRQLPNIDDLADTLTGDLPLETATVWKVLAVILWLAWLQIVIAVAVEVIAAARGAMPRSLPGFNLAHGLVAPLVTAIVLAWPAGVASRASAAFATPTVPARDPAPPAAAPLALDEPASINVVAQSAPGVVDHTVRRRDTLWDLAERYLGDGYRATEIFELNKGRPQPDGGALTDPSVIRPGWVLQIPAAATEVATADTVTVQPGDSLWEIAAGELGNGHRFTEIVELNAGRPQPDGRALTDPDVIEPGWVLHLPTQVESPPVTAPASTASPPASTASPPPASPVTEPTTPAPAPAPPSTSPAVSAAQPLDDVDDTAATEEGLRVPVGLVGGGIATAGLLAVLERRRRAQLRRRQRGEVAPPLDERLRDAEVALRHGVEPDRTTAVDVATRDALAQSGATGLPSLHHVESSDDAITIDLRDAAPAPPGFGAASPTRWETSRARSTNTAVGSPAPALVPVGVTDDGADVLIDLETPAVTWLSGDDANSKRLLNAMATAVTTTPWSEHARVVWVGDTPPRLDGVEHVVSLDDALAALEARAQLVNRALDAARCTTVAQARAAGVTPDMWSPCVVLSPISPTPAQVERIQSLADLVSASIALVTLGEPSTSGSSVRRICISDDGTATIDGSLTVRAQFLDDADLDLVVDLLAQADEPCVPHQAGQTARSRSEASVSSLDDLLREVDVVVRVLGEVEAVHLNAGGEERIAVPKQKSLEAVTYLALREGRVDREDLQAALWPAGANSAKTFHNTIWAARKMLADSGTDLFPEPVEGHYLLSDRVVTDYGLFNELTSQAEELEDPVAAADLLAAGLTLVRGEPFTGVGRGYAWAAPHAGLIVAQVVDAAEELAEVRLAAGDWRGAEWAARQGLRVFPCEERLYRLLMRAAHAAGSIPGVHRAFQELAAAVADPDDGVEPDDTLHPETVALLEELTGQRSTVDRASA
jgi:nucleoid-associated protein YgaU/DNA-binding SARP family transcriptional activator